MTTLTQVHSLRQGTVTQSQKSMVTGTGNMIVRPKELQGNFYSKDKEKELLQILDNVHALNPCWNDLHSEAIDQQCQITGMSCTPKLEKAVEKGYQILHIQQVWHFETTKVGLFEKYVNMLLKLKEEASGWPSHLSTDLQKRQQHLCDYEVKGIKLDPPNIMKKPGPRTLAKMKLNSMWGKFGQPTNKTQVVEFNDPQRATSLTSTT